MAHELMVEEYKSLRQEILQLAGSISRWQMVGFIAAALGVGLAEGQVVFGAIRVACGLLVVAGCVWGIIHDLRSILRIAAYIQSALEGRDTGALWETRQAAIAGVDILNPLRGYMTPIPALLWAGTIAAVLQIGRWVLLDSTGARIPNERQFYWGLGIRMGLLVIWLLFGLMVRRSYRAFATGEFRRKTTEAFFDSLRQSGGNSTNNQI